MKEYLKLGSLYRQLVGALLTLSLFCVSSLSYAEPIPEVEDHFSIGALVVHNSAAYDGNNGFVLPMPAIDIRFGRLFIYNQHDEPTIGWELFRHKRITLSIAATRGRTFLDLDDINNDKKFLYYGLENRNQATEAGLIFQFYSRVGLFEAKTFHDMVSAYGGTRSSLSIERPFPDTGNWSIIPRFYVKHYSEKFNGYYYGITQSETDAGADIATAEGIGDGNAILASEYTKLRPTYTPGNSGHVGVDLSVVYSFTENVKAIGYLGIEKFSGEVETSRLTEDTELITSSIGLRYDF